MDRLPLKDRNKILKALRNEPEQVAEYEPMPGEDEHKARLERIRQWTEDTKKASEAAEPLEEPYAALSGESGEGQPKVRGGYLSFAWAALWAVLWAVLWMPLGVLLLSSPVWVLSIVIFVLALAPATWVLTQVDE